MDTWTHEHRLASLHARLLSLLLLLALALALLAPLILLAGCIRHTHLVHFSFFHIHLLHSHLLVICIILCIYILFTHTDTRGTNTETIVEEVEEHCFN